MCGIGIQNAKAVLPFQSINAATSPTTGVALDLNGVARDFSLQLVVTGSPDLDSTGVRLQGSLDGVSWVQLDVSTAINGELIYGTKESASVRPYVRYVRASLTAVGSGTSPTFTIWIAAGEVI